MNNEEYDLRTKKTICTVGGRKLADGSFGAMSWGTGKPPAMKLREPFLWSKVRERERAQWVGTAQ